VHFYYLTHFIYLQGAEFELDSIKKLSKEYAEAKELALAGAYTLVTCALHFLHVCTILELYLLEHWFEPSAIRLPLLSTLTEAGQTVDLEDAEHFLQSDTLFGDKIDEIVKEWDAIVQLRGGKSFSHSEQL